MTDKIKEWEKRNKILVSKIGLFYKIYEKENLDEFEKNEFRSHTKMLVLAGKLFNKEINKEVDCLWNLNKDFLVKASN